MHPKLLNSEIKSDDCFAGKSFLIQFSLVDNIIFVITFLLTNVLQTYVLLESLFLHGMLIRILVSLLKETNVTCSNKLQQFSCEKTSSHICQHDMLLYMQY